MKNEAILLDSGVKCLSEMLGMVEAERFISLIIKNQFDYTEWRRDNLFVGMSVEEISEAAGKNWKDKYGDNL